MNKIKLSKILKKLKNKKIKYRFQGHDNIKLTHPSNIENAADGSLCFYRGKDKNVLLDGPNNNNF
jgi:hypothetical protein